MPWIEVVILVLVGLSAGSFLNVVIYRIPRKESVVSPPSHCPACDAPVRHHDNVPVVSWLLLRGRCRDCKAAIPLHYPLVEAATTGLFLAAGYRFGGSYVQVAAACALAAALLALALIDLEHFILPDRVLFPATGIVVALLVVSALHGHRWSRLEDAAIGGAGALAVFAAIHFAYPAGMGFGDVKLSFVIGFFLGWVRLAAVPVGFFLAFAVATVVSLGLIVAGKGGRKTKIPFGPFLAVGAAAGIEWGLPITRAWLGH